MNDNKKNRNNSSSGLPVGICIGISIGTAIGAATRNMGTWIPIGLSAGADSAVISSYNFVLPGI